MFQMITACKVITYTSTLRRRSVLVADTIMFLNGGGNLALSLTTLVPSRSVAMLRVRFPGSTSGIKRHEGVVRSVKRKLNRWWVSVVLMVGFSGYWLVPVPIKNHSYTCLASPTSNASMTLVVEDVPAFTIVPIQASELAIHSTRVTRGMVMRESGKVPCGMNGNSAVPHTWAAALKVEYGV